MTRIKERGVSLVGEGVKFQPNRSAGAFFNEVSRVSENIATDLQAKADVIYTNNFLSDARKGAREAYNRNVDNPNQLEKELGEFQKGLVKNAPSRLRPALEQSYGKVTNSYITRSQETFNKLQTIEQNKSLKNNEDVILNDAVFAAQGLFENDPTLNEDQIKAKQLASIDQITNDFEDLNKNLSQLGPDGNPLRTSAQVASSVIKAKEFIFSAAGQSFIDSRPDKIQAYKEWLSDEVTLDMPEGQINVRKDLSPEVREKVDAELLANIKRDIFLNKEQRKKEDKKALQYLNLKLVNSAMSGEIPLDPTNKDDKDAVDSAWDQMLNRMIQKGGTVNEILEVAADLTVKTGVIPRRIESIMSANILNGTVEDKVAYSDYLSKVSRKNPRGLQNVDDNVSALAITISNNLSAGLSEEDSVAWAEADIDEAKKEERSFRRSKWKDKKENEKSTKRLVKDLQDEEGFDLFRANPIVPDALRAEYLRLEEGFFLNQNVDRKTARDLATGQIRETWRQTEVGPKRMMKYAPEVMYGNDAGTKWIEDQLLDFTKSKKGEVTLEINLDTITQDKPTYFISKINEFGTIDFMLNEKNEPISYKPDWKTSKKYKELQEKSAANQPTRDEVSENIKESRDIQDLVNDPINSPLLNTF